MANLILKTEANKGHVETKVDVEKATVSCVHFSKNKKANATYLLTWLLDFRYVTDEDILRMAAENLKITIRRGFTDATKPKAEDWDGVTFNAADFLVTRRSAKSKGESAMAAMSKADILAYLEGRDDDEKDSK